MQRSNRVNKTLQGCVYAEINKSCINKLMKIIPDEGNSDLSNLEMKHLLCIARDANQKSKILLVSSQNGIYNKSCTTYSR